MIDTTAAGPGLSDTWELYLSMLKVESADVEQSMIRQEAHLLVFECI